LIIIGMNFGKSEKAVAIAAIIHKSRLKRRFNPCYLGEIDVSFELFVLSGFEIKFIDPVSLDDGDPGFLPVARVDQHTHCQDRKNVVEGKRWSGRVDEGG